MRKLFYVMLFFTALSACRKDSPVSKQEATVSTQPRLSLEQVQQWYAAKKDSSGIRTTQSTGRTFSLSRLAVPWEKAISMNNKKGNYWLVNLAGQPTFQGIKQGYRKIAFYRDDTEGIRAAILEIIPDALYFQRKRKVTTADFTGRILFYDEHYRLLSGKIFAGGKQVGEIKTKQDPDQSTAEGSGVHTDALQIVQDCVWYDSSYIDSEGVVTIYSERICSTTIYDDAPFSGGGGFETGSGDYAGNQGGNGGNPTSAPQVSNLPGESKPGINPKSLMDCFQNIADAGAKMTVTVYVQEPFPGTTFNIGPNSVGHTAIGLTKSNGGQSVTQVVGFYPNATGLDKMHAPSKIVDNGGDLEYNVSISYTVDAQHFNQIANYIASPPAVYDLTTFNCTDFVMGACTQGGITLPSAVNTVGLSGPGGAMTANTPAGLGDSIENMNGSNINKNGGTAPFSKGACN